MLTPNVFRDIANAGIITFTDASLPVFRLPFGEKMKYLNPPGKIWKLKSTRGNCHFFHMHIKESKNWPTKKTTIQCSDCMQNTIKKQLILTQLGLVVN